MRYLRLAAPFLAAVALAACTPTTPPVDTTTGGTTSTPTSTPAAVVDPIENLNFTITPLAGWNGDNTCSGEIQTNCGLVLAKNRFTLEIIQGPMVNAGDDGYLLPATAAATSTEAVIWVRTMDRGYKRTDRYLGRPDGQFVWVGSVFAGTSGRVLHPTNGVKPTFAIRTIYNRTTTSADALSGLPVRGSEELDATLVEVNRMVESIQLK